jgi:hypothetical protein
LESYQKSQNTTDYYFDDTDSIIISKDLIRQQVFEPVVNNVLELINNQLEKSNEPLNAILLLGGFGKNPYLLEKTRETFSQKLRIHYIQNDDNGDLAVMRGAIYYGLEELRYPKVVSLKTTPFYDQQFSSHQYNAIVCIGKYNAQEI